MYGARRYRILGSGEDEIWNTAEDAADTVASNLRIKTLGMFIAKTYKQGIPHHTNNEIIMDSQYYYLLNIALFLKEIDTALVAYDDNEDEAHRQVIFLWNNIKGTFTTYADLAILFSRVIPNWFSKLGT